MYFNWFDYILLAIILGSLIFGLIKGLIRQIIGLSALIVGLVLAIYFYKNAAESIFFFISNRILSYLFGFLLIFLSIIILGLIISFLLSKIAKGPLKSLNHFLGGVFGLIRGVLICLIIVFLLLIFPFGKLNERILSKTKLTPYCITGIKIVVDLVPKEIKDEFNKNYKKLAERIGENGKRI